MNKSVSLLITIILIAQMASLSFNDAPSSVDSEDTFTSDEQWLVSGRDNGTENNTSNECLMFNNVSYDYNYSSAPQDSFNITADLFNYCSEKIMYPSTLILNEIQGINVSSDSVNWRYAIYGNYSYPVSWLITRDSTVVEGTFVTFEIHPTIDNCSENCSESQNNSYNLSIPFGLIDVNSCYILDNVSDDYIPSEMSFNLSASLNNTCGGDIHYPSGVLYDGDGTVSSPAEGVQNIGAMAYMIYGNTSTTVNWQISINQNISNGTLVNFSLQPVCSMYNIPISVGSFPSYMQDCSYSIFDQVLYTVMVGVPLNQTVNPANYSGVCPESHPYPSDPEGPGDNSSATNWCCVDPYVEEWNECYPTYDEIPCPSGGPCGQYKSPANLCEDWEYWNPDLIDTTLLGNGCPYYIDESNTEDEDTGGNATGGNATGDDSCEVWEYWNPDLIDTTLPGNGCPHHIDESSTEDDDSGGEDTWEDLCEVWEYWNPDLIDTTLPGNGCPHYIDESSTEGDESGLLPSIGVVGTLAAIGVGFIVVTRREQEE
jgi:hypothetical protein